MMRYDIKPDYHLKAKRRYLTAFSVGLVFAFQAARVLWNFSLNAPWKNGLAIAGSLGCLLISGVGYWKYRKLVQYKNKKKIH